MLPEHEKLWYDKTLAEQANTIKVLEKRLYEWQKAYNVINHELYNRLVKVLPTNEVIPTKYRFTFYENDQTFDNFEDGLKWSMELYDRMYPKP